MKVWQKRMRKEQIKRTWYIKKYVWFHCSSLLNTTIARTRDTIKNSTKITRHIAVHAYSCSTFLRCRRLRFGWLRVRLITRSMLYACGPHESLLTRIVRGSNDTAGHDPRDVDLWKNKFAFSQIATASIARRRRIVIVEVSFSKPSSARRFSRIRF